MHSHRLVPFGLHHLLSLYLCISTYTNTSLSCQYYMKWASHHITSHHIISTPLFGYHRRRVSQSDAVNISGFMYDLLWTIQSSSFSPLAHLVPFLNILLLSPFPISFLSGFRILILLLLPNVYLTFLFLSLLHCLICLYLVMEESLL